MRTVSVMVAAMFGVAVFGGGAIAQERFENPAECVPAVAALDANGDGYVDNTEYSEFDKVRTNVDTNFDGYISRDERTVACRDGVFTALKPFERR